MKSSVAPVVVPVAIEPNETVGEPRAMFAHQHLVQGIQMGATTQDDPDTGGLVDLFTLGGRRSARRVDRGVRRVRGRPGAGRS
jgi:hypothetical protein